MVGDTGLDVSFSEGGVSSDLRQGGSLKPGVDSFKALALPGIWSGSKITTIIQFRFDYSALSATHMSIDLWQESRPRVGVRNT